MRSAHRPALAEPPRQADVAVIGAGAAGIAAARRLRALGLTVAVTEARDRVGGRAVTVPFRGHPLDLGAHWLHAGPINPLVSLGGRRGERLRRAPEGSLIFVRGRPAGRAAAVELARAFAVADRAMAAAAAGGEDRPMSQAMPSAGPFGRRVASVNALVSGRPLAEVSLLDHPDMDYGDNRFIAGGLGAYVARLAEGLPIRLSAPATAVDWSGRGVRVETAAGTLAARAAILALPVAVLQTGAVRFTPALPNLVAEALHGFTQGVYEHVVLHWPNGPFRGADRLAGLYGTRRSPPGLMTSIDGAPFHYFELDAATAAALDRRDRDAPARFARAVLAEQFGARALAGLSIPAATAWRHDPFALASWAVVPPGKVPIRAALAAPVGERLWFAGEALAPLQWGTAGGAWQEGERAADAIAIALRPS